MATSCRGLSVGTLAACATLALMAAVSPGRTAAASDGMGWVGTWSTAEVAAASSGPSATGFEDQTVRNVVHTTVGGSAVRIRLSNVFGSGPLTVDDAYVGVRSAGAAIEPGTNRQATFGGAKRVTIPAGQRAVSDPVALPVGAEQDLAVSIYFAGPTGPATWHQDAISTNYYSDAGDHSAENDAAAYTNTTTSWYFLDGVDVLNPDVRGSVVTFGPSTTDGDASTVDANVRYPDDLARRLLQLPAREQMSVLNAGISGNQLLADGGTSGVSGLARFYRDAIEQTGVRVVIIWEGTNDIGGHPSLAPSQLTDAYQELIDVAHQHGVRVIGATLQPDKGAGYYTEQGNEVRKAVNDWIRTSGAFDGVADFDKALLDPSDPDRMLPLYDSGDHLHPNNAGYQAIADSINLRLLTGASAGPLLSGIGTASPASLTLKTGGSGTDTITVQSLTGSRFTLPWKVQPVTADPGHGVTVDPGHGMLTVPANGTATVRVTVTAGDTEGSFPVIFNLLNQTGESALATRFAVNVVQPGDLAPFYNNTGISDDGVVGQADLAGGWSYSEQALAAAGLAPGATVNIGGLTYTWPDVPAGRPDNVQAAGQTIIPDLPAGANELGFLGTGSNSGTVGSEGTLTITYTDGTTSAVPLGFSGYALGFGGPVLFGNVIVATLPYRNDADGTSQAVNMYVFAQTVPVDGSKTVASVTLPTAVSQGQIHVFALSHR